MRCRTEARVERNTARATCVPRAATATRLLNRVLGVYGYSGFRRESKITRELDHKRRWANLCFGYAPPIENTSEWATRQSVSSEIAVPFENRLDIDDRGAIDCLQPL